jgi:hypothetical protein
MAALPKSVVLSLLYRLMVLYAASRILPLLKDGGPPRWLRPQQYETDEDDMDDYTDEEEWDTDEEERRAAEKSRRRAAAEPKKLSEEEPFGACEYRRPLELGERHFEDLFPLHSHPNHRLVLETDHDRGLLASASTRPESSDLLALLDRRHYAHIVGL